MNLEASMQACCILCDTNTLQREKGGVCTGIIVPAYYLVFYTYKLDQTLFLCVPLKPYGVGI